MGAAAFDAAEYRKIRLHKENGFNAVRCAHNPPSRGLLEACDKLGILVIDEAFDMWRLGKNAEDYHVFYEDWWERDLEAMILRDRNHPSVIMWSIGNEVEERTGAGQGVRLAEEMAACVRSWDPSRFVTAALCGIFPSFWEKRALAQNQAQQPDSRPTEATDPMPRDGAIQDFMNNDFVRANLLPRTEAWCKPLDIVGYNYLDYLYGKSAELYPERVICGMESFPLKSAEAWEAVERFPHVIGDFAWVSHDYLGEAGIGKVSYSPNPPDGASMMLGFCSPFPWRTANNGDFDLCGFDRPQLHYRKIVWGDPETYLAVRHPQFFGQYEILSQWGWPDVRRQWSWTGYENKPIAIEVYSGAQEVELLVNGVSLGRKPVGKANAYKTRFETVYIPGEIEAISYLEGNVISRDTLCTVGKPAAIRLVADRTALAAEGQDLCFVTVEIVDANGYRVPDAEVKLNAKVAGKGTLAAFGSARPVTMENYTTGNGTSYEGRLLAVIRSAREAGTVTLNVAAAEFESAAVTLPVE